MTVRMRVPVAPTGEPVRPPSPLAVGKEVDDVDGALVVQFLSRPHVFLPLSEVRVGELLDVEGVVTRIVPEVVVPAIEGEARFDAEQVIRVRVAGPVPDVRVYFAAVDVLTQRILELGRWDQLDSDLSPGGH